MSSPLRQLCSDPVARFMAVLAVLLLLPTGPRAQGKTVPKTVPGETGLPAAPKTPGREVPPRNFNPDWLAPATTFNKHRTPVQRAQTAIDCIVYEVCYPSEGKFNHLGNKHCRTLRTDADRRPFPCSVGAFPCPPPRRAYGASRMSDVKLPHQALDIDLKAFFRVHKELPFRLLGRLVDPAYISAEDTAIVIRELRADRFFLYTPPDAPHEGLTLELFMKVPERDDLLRCLMKPLQLMRDFRVPVVQVLLYLNKGDRANFPDGLTVEVLGGLRNHFQVERCLLWEHADEIRDGTLGALAPFLLLWEDNPEVNGARVLREELRILEAAPLSPAGRAESLALAYLIGLREFTPRLLRDLFGDKMIQVKQSETIQEWLHEASTEAAARAHAVGLQEGLQQGRLSRAHELLLKQGRLRLGRPRKKALAALAAVQDDGQLDALALRLLQAKTWEELLDLK